MKIVIGAILSVLGISGVAIAQQPEQEIDPSQLGEVVYQSYCANCHGQRVPKAPDPLMIKHMTADSVYTAITAGVMAEQGAALHEDERKAVAEFLTGKVLGQEDTDPNLTQCKDIAFDRSDRLKIRDWGIDYKNTRYQDPATYGLSNSAPENLEVAWSLAFPGAVRVRSQPAFAGGFMYMGSQDGAVYALDAATGCQHWKYQAVSEVRTSIAISEYDEGNGQIIVVFGDYLGNFYGVDAVTGEELWKVRPHEHPHATITGTPRIHGNRAFVTIASHEDGSAVRADYPCCTFRGAAASVDIRSGETNWITYTVKDEATPRKLNSAGTRRWGSSGAASWTTPAIDVARNQMYIGTGDNYSGPATDTSDSVIALDLDTGKINWVFQATSGDTWNGACMLPVNGPNCPENEGPDYDFGASMIIAKGNDGREYLLAGQKSGAAFAIDPDTGKMLWKNKVGRGGIQGGVHFGMAAVGGTVFVPVSDMIYAEDAEVYTDPAVPGLYALDIVTSELLWSWKPTEDNCRGNDVCDPGLSAPPTIIGDYILAGALDGWLRVHNRHTGEIVWSIDTTQSVTGINGVTGHGGSLNGTGPVAYDGRIYLPSGYGMYDHMPGNVLIVLQEKK